MNSTVVTFKVIFYFLFFRTAASEKHTKTSKGNLSLLNKIHQKKNRNFHHCQDVPALSIL